MTDIDAAIETMDARTALVALGRSIRNRASTNFGRTFTFWPAIPVLDMWVAVSCALPVTEACAA